MNKIEQLRQEVTTELDALESTLDEYEESLAEIDGLLADKSLKETESVTRQSAFDGEEVPVQAD